MKINYKTRDELRRIVEEQLGGVPDGEKIHLDVSLLEELLFEREMLDDEAKLVGKIPVWTGEFLRKIDLSEVSFEGVCWDPETYLTEEKIKKFDIEIEDIDFSYTNANIDFSKAFTTMRHSGAPSVSVVNCNFEGLDLSKNDLSSISIDFIGTNLVGTRLNLQSANNTNSTYCDINTTGCNLSGLDLSWLTVELKDFTEEEAAFNLFGANFSNTGLRINGNVEDLDHFEQERFSEAIREGRLEGCYINDRLIKPMKSTEEIQQIKENKKSEYEQMRTDLISAVTQSIETQKNSFRR